MGTGFSMWRGIYSGRRHNMGCFGGLTGRTLTDRSSTKSNEGPGNDCRWIPMRKGSQILYRQLYIYFSILPFI